MRKIWHERGVSVFYLRYVLKMQAYDRKQVAQLSQRNRAAPWVSFGWVVDDGVGH